jgi:diguanylate cyclase (GGDEF)-like protein
VLVSAISIVLVNYAVVRPVNQLSQAAKDYRNDEDVTNHSHFKELEIRTQDEIEDLSESMKKMEQDLNDKIANLLQTTIALTESRIEISKMSEIAMKDAMTGVRNKRAYDNDIQMIEQSLADDPDGSAAKFGLAVIDLNDLKKINDTYGHEKGDIAIKKLCGIVCAIFSHSPVYRIGGDEFTVILQGQDLDNIKTLLKNFDSIVKNLNENDKLEPWEKVTASIGYAVFDADRDGTPDGTFRQADRAMYMQKQKMKSIII